MNLYRLYDLHDYTCCGVMGRKTGPKEPVKSYPAQLIDLTFVFFLSFKLRRLENQHISLEN